MKKRTRKQPTLGEFKRKLAEMERRFCGDRPKMKLGMAVGMFKKREDA